MHFQLVAILLRIAKMLCVKKLELSKLEFILINNGATVPTVSKFLGHTKIEETLKYIYTFI